MKEKRSLVTCPGRDDKGGKCKMVVDDVAMLKILNPEEKAKYVDAMVQSFIDSNEAYKVLKKKRERGGEGRRGEKRGEEGGGGERRRKEEDKLNERGTLMF